ncbi:MAG: DUF4868 domain-containing protein [Alphaproteobacteria bacterium]|nr:DUF4868 domain-containing protein [Alphaproteobacteria bacterium]
MAFDITDLRIVEFFIQKDNGLFYKIAMTREVQEILVNMVENTEYELGDNINDYSPSEKYNSEDKLQISLNSDYCRNILEIYNNNDISVDNQQIVNNPEDIIYYFCRLTDNNNETLLAIKKATYFKAVTAQHAWYIQFISDALKTFSGSLFKLDKSFDILVFNNIAYINKYLVFESIADLGETVRLASATNIRIIEQNTPVFIFSDEAKEYIQNHIMAARLVASIKSSGRLNNLSLDEVISACRKQNISINISNDQISFDADNTMNFLKLIDRRLFTINLTGEDENYEAKSRQER